MRLVSVFNSTEDAAADDKKWLESLENDKH